MQYLKVARLDFSPSIGEEEHVYCQVFPVAVLANLVLVQVSVL
jgi:hypothetical protein